MSSSRSSPLLLFHLVHGSSSCYRCAPFLYSRFRLICPSTDSPVLSTLPLLYLPAPPVPAMESPAVPLPIDPKEQPILERLLRIRDALLLMKQDKSSYIKYRDVLPHYEDVIAEVEKLNGVREEQDRRLTHNRC